MTYLGTYLARSKTFFVRGFCAYDSNGTLKMSRERLAEYAEHITKYDPFYKKRQGSANSLQGDSNNQLGDSSLMNLGTSDPKIQKNMKTDLQQDKWQKKNEEAQPYGIRVSMNPTG